MTCHPCLQDRQNKQFCRKYYALSKLYTVIKYKDHYENVTAEVIDLGKNALILGFSWLKYYSPEIDWIKSLV